MRHTNPLRKALDRLPPAPATPGKPYRVGNTRYATLAGAYRAFDQLPADQRPAVDLENWPK